jgi:acetyl-CoA carboxylase biotin carboxyl carrier protein
MPGAKNKRAGEAPAPKDSGVDLVQVERVLNFMASHQLEEFEYSNGNVHIRLKRATAARNSQGGQPAAQVSLQVPPATAAAVPESETFGAPPEESGRPGAPKEELHVIKSPIVGTFYSSPSPEAPPFVKVGDAVQAGQVVCIVEAMKLMNEIEADIGGELVAVLAENGQPVEYGQSLFALRPAKKKK